MMIANHRATRGARKTNSSDVLRTILKAAQPEKLDSNIYTHFDLIQFYLSLQRQNKHTNTIEEKTLFISYSLKWSEPIYISINTQSKDINNDLRRVKNRQIAEGIKDLKSQFYRCGRVGSISSLISLWFLYDLVVTKRHSGNWSLQQTVLISVIFVVVDTLEVFKWDEYIFFLHTSSVIWLMFSTENIPIQIVSIIIQNHKPALKNTSDNHIMWWSCLCIGCVRWHKLVLVSV